jgi:hypothetical protein
MAEVGEVSSSEYPEKAAQINNLSVSQETVFISRGFSKGFGWARRTHGVPRLRGF